MKKYVLVGASGRGYGMFAKPMVEKFGDVAKLAGIFDINIVRAEYIRDNTDPSIPVYTDFDKMMQEVKPDAAIIVTIDRFHHEYIIRALEYGCEVISEKPMTIDEVKCNEILAAEKKYGKNMEL
jgi:predicted dehydrogenase